MVEERDSIGPDPESWSISAPARKDAPLQIMLHESLDHYLLQETVSVVDNARHDVAGSFTSSARDSKLSFLPSQPWNQSNYFLRVAGILEDLAGNNLNRPFDRDISSTPLKESRDFIEVPFRVQFLP